MLFGLSWLSARGRHLAQAQRRSPAARAPAGVLRGLRAGAAASPSRSPPCRSLLGAGHVRGRAGGSGRVLVASKAAGSPLIRVMGRWASRAPRADQLTFLPRAAPSSRWWSSPSLSMTVGNLAALRQHGRLLAWSSIAHAGCILLALGVVRAAWRPCSPRRLPVHEPRRIPAGGVLIRESARGRWPFTGSGTRRAWASPSAVLQPDGPAAHVRFRAATVFYAVFEQGYAWLGVIDLINDQPLLLTHLTYMYLADRRSAPTCPGSRSRDSTGCSARRSWSRWWSSALVEPHPQWAREAVPRRS
jgi:hypothetical protein